MDVTIQSVNLQIPSSDIQFLKELANRMGWKTNTVNSETSKTELDKAILDVKKGNVKNFDTLEEMMNYLDAKKCISYNSLEDLSNRTRSVSNEDMTSLCLRKL